MAQSYSGPEDALVSTCATVLTSCRSLEYPGCAAVALIHRPVEFGVAGTRVGLWMLRCTAVTLVLLLLFILATPQGRTGFNTVLFVMQVLDLPIKPQSWVTAEPLRHRVERRIGQHHTRLRCTVRQVMGPGPRCCCPWARLPRDWMIRAWSCSATPWPGRVT